MPSAGWIHIWEQWSPQCTCVFVCVCVCVCVWRRWGKCFWARKFPSGPGVQSSESCDPYWLCWATGQTPGPSLIPTSLHDARKTDSSLPKVSGRWLWFGKGETTGGSRQDHVMQHVIVHRVRSCTCYVFSPPFYPTISLSLTHPHTFFFFFHFSPPSPSPDFKASTWPLLYPSEWDCCEYIWHVWRNFKTHRHPRPLQRKTHEDRYQCVPKDLCKLLRGGERFVITDGANTGLRELWWAD